MAPTVRCPSCGGELTGATACPTCGQPLTGPLALRVWQVDQTIAALQAERAALLGQLRTDASRPFGSTSSTQPLVATPVAATATGRQLSGQQVLLWAGALLVLTAATVFLAVTWTAIGVTGQVLVMSLLTVLAGAVTLRLARRGLRATAEALAVLTFGLAVVDLVAAYQLNLGGLREVDGSLYVTFAAALLAVMFCLLSRRDLTLHAWCWAAVSGAVIVPLAALDAADASTATSAGVVLLGAAAFGLARHAVKVAWRFYRAPLLLAGAGYLVLTWCLALPEVFDGRVLGTAGISALIALVAAAGCAVLARVDRGLGSFVDHPLLASAAVLATVITMMGLAGHAEPAGLVVLVVLAADATGWGLRAPGTLGQRRLGVLVLAAQLAAAGALLYLFALSDLWTSAPSWVPLTISLASLAGAGAVVTVRQPGLRGFAAGYTSAAALGAAGVAAYPQGWTWTASALLAVALASAVAAGKRRGHAEELTLAVVSLLAVCLAAACGVEAGARSLAGVLAAAGLAALAYGVLPRRGYVAVLGVLGCSAATWTLLLDADVTTIEAYSLPLAGLAAVVGVVRLLRQPGTPSWLSVGPALTAALLPSAVVSVDDDGRSGR